MQACACRVLFGLGLVLAVWLGGCHSFDCAVAGLHGYTCDPVYPVACTPESRAMGYCKDVPTHKQVQK